MGKLDELRRGAGSNAAESMGTRDRRDQPHGGDPCGSHGQDPLPGARTSQGGQRDPYRPANTQPEPAARSSMRRRCRSWSRVSRAWASSNRSESAGTRSWPCTSSPPGSHRFRAAKMAGLKSVPCVIQEGELTESQRLIEQFAQDIIRADLQPVEQAKAFRRLMDLNGWSGSSPGSYTSPTRTSCGRHSSVGPTQKHPGTGRGGPLARRWPTRSAGSTTPRSKPPWPSGLSPRNSLATRLSQPSRRRSRAGPRSGPGRGRRDDRHPGHH